MRWAKPFSIGLALAGISLVGMGSGAYHRTPLDAPESTNLPPSLLLTNNPLKRLREGAYALGLVELDRSNRTVRFPGSVNMVDGLVEYAIVHSTGKVHESVLRTSADPLHIHLARLLLSSTNTTPMFPPPGAPRDLWGPKVSLWVSWTLNGVEKRVPLEDLVSNTMTQARMTRGNWVFNGSRIVEGTFLAHRDGSVVAIISDPDALMNSPRPGRDDDEIWKPNAGLVPPVGTPVEITIQLENDS